MVNKICIISFHLNTLYFIKILVKEKLKKDKFFVFLSIEGFAPKKKFLQFAVFFLGGEVKIKRLNFLI